MTKEPPMDNELKPCPFCGSRANLEKSMEDYWVECNRLSCYAGTHAISFKSKKTAIKNWNTRINPPDPVAVHHKIIKELYPPVMVRPKSAERKRALEAFNSPLLWKVPKDAEAYENAKMCCYLFLHEHREVIRQSLQQEE